MPAPTDILLFLRGQIFETPSLPDFDFSGKTVIITGANSGLGYECAQQLVGLHVTTLILGCRDVAKGETARNQILSSAGVSQVDIQVWEIDMADYTSVINFGQRVDRDLPCLDALIANAGISTNVFSLAEGLEQTLTVNVVSTFLLCLLCLPALERAAKLTGTPTHLVVTGSNVHAFADPSALMDPAPGVAFQQLSDPKKADMPGRYFLSKLIVLLCMQEMAERMQDSRPSTSVIFSCPTPGWCKTPLFRQDDGGFWGRNMLKLMGRTGEVGARTLTSAITAGQETHGKYLSEGRVKSTSVWVRSAEGRIAQTRIWRELSFILRSIVPSIGGELLAT